MLYTDQDSAYRAPHTPTRGTGWPSSGVGQFFESFYLIYFFFSVYFSFLEIVQI
jgi:hypothetical protein